ncbi:heparin/heparan-sulfate lyase [Dysgonomonas hofstadii]|uniref:Heparin/heparan-sulfate lyase n=1 Tax=Dysgonomonas hofstadii TaxID=637886 RepID=A0A840CN47_9BACT|nr:heparinase II/III family protein [Dysgonomonas hofstadii]MBB4034944.1 heparin/heparan-sulfate lyase [Dysgonomonas hofstadii]
MNKNKDNISYLILLITGILLLSGTSVCAKEILTDGKYSVTLYANKADINKKTTKIIGKIGTPKIKLVTLKDNITERASNEIENDPDITYQIKLPVAGKYRIFAEVVREDKVIPGMKVETRLVKLKIDGQRITRRIISNLHEYSGHDLGIFDLQAESEIKMWLPEKISFESIRIEEYMPIAVPNEAANYIPYITPPSDRPSLWVNKNNLPSIRKRLTKGENLPVWQEVQKKAKQPYPFEFDVRKEMFHNNEIEKIALIKAFYYLMTDDRKVGQEVVNLMLNYLSVLEFGNVRHGDITRELGQSIYTAAITYDWCYNLLSENDRHTLYNHMMRLAPEMEIGWPPFKEHVVNGHASEAQVNRDLLAMSIAIYDIDPQPYRYTSYLLLEHLLPMRAFEYQSPRHNQGFDYGAYRHGWEMHAAWMFYRMTGVRIFNDNITSLSKYWIYMQLPDGKRFSDGDKFSKTHVSYPETLLLDYAYADDAVLKGEFERRGGLSRAKDNPILFLLVNNPDLKTNPDLNTLPLSIDYGNILGGLSARTGWNMEEGSNDVAAEIRGGGYHFGNHQHCDAGSFQIYFHGEQVFNVGIYRAYGTPYDFNFYKRSVAHNTILVKDPDEKLAHRTNINDGGSRFNQRNPKTPEEAMNDPWFDYGTVISADFEANTLKPSYSYFKADLTAAYYSKTSNYTRSFCFLNLNREDIPAAIILADDLITSKNDFEKYWKINTFNQPSFSDQNVVLHNSSGGQVGKTHMNMLLPRPEDRQIEISSLKDSTSVLGLQYQIKYPTPEANAYQVVAYPKKNKKHNRFLTVFQMTADGTEPLPVDFYETDNKYVISLQDRIVCMSAGYGQIQDSFSLNIDRNTEIQILITDLKPGFWNIRNMETNTDRNFKVEAGKNTIFFKGGKGKYIITPGRSYVVGE